MLPDPSNLIKQLDLNIPLMGFYDAPLTQGFEPLIRPEPGKHQCIFCFYENWLKGETLVITKDNFGCSGAGSCLCDVQTRTKENLVKFLKEGEGLKATSEIMNEWVDHREPYVQEHPFLLIGPFKSDRYDLVKTVTFFVNPDQLSSLIIGANYRSVPGDIPAVIAPFGAGCMELLPLFSDLNVPQAIIGATDIAMRQYLPGDIMAFTVTKPMFEQLCSLGKDSFLYKPFLKNLKKARAANPQ
ncbi:MAG TPA: DUF169 domain-containing protein [Deltaproteobacteria bacterium]|nr:DUF169 domain-containing protein [Deltaproteobacteria bacterium]